MCGIVGAIAERNVTPILIEGLKRLEYRGYDSAGVALITQTGQLERRRRLGKVDQLVQALEESPLLGTVGIAHTRWATHGEPSERNAHPHFSHTCIGIVHNGIIENYAALRAELAQKNYQCESETDTEVIAHCLHAALNQYPSTLKAFQSTIKTLKGAYALAIVIENQPVLWAARSGSPLVIGLGIGENFVASDPLALRQVTDRFIYLEEGDIAEIKRDSFTIWNAAGDLIEREITHYHLSPETTDKGQYRHFMHKEIYEQPKVIQQTLAERIGKTSILLEAFGHQAVAILPKVEHIQLIACGTSFHAAMVARYWIEALTGIACHVEVASEYRYRDNVVPANSLLITLSQSGETADTLAALRKAQELGEKGQGYLSTLAICNAPMSTLVRESDLTFLTHAGMEIGVASTKAFTTQLVALLLLTLALRQVGQKDLHNTKIYEALANLPDILVQVLAVESVIEKVAEKFRDKQHCLFVGRGAYYPIAMEGALKLKEISYIHAEAYPAGELKHGPLALVDNTMPVIAIMPNDRLVEKLKSNLQEVRARGGQLIVFADEDIPFEEDSDLTVIRMPRIHEWLAPIMYTLPLQLLAYHVAVLKGTDVDQPRNLAKSVTVE